MHECLNFEALKEQVKREIIKETETNQANVGAGMELDCGACDLLSNIPGELTNELKSDQKNEINSDQTIELKSDQTIELKSDQTNELKNDQTNEPKDCSPKNCSPKKPLNISKKEMEILRAKMIIKTITPTHLYNHFQQLLDQGIDKYLFLVDLQVELKFKDYHIKNAVHIKNEETITEMKKEIELKQNAKVIFYYTNDRVENRPRYDRLLYGHFANVKANFYFLKGGYKSFEKEYFFLCIPKNGRNRNISAFINFQANIQYPIKFCSNIFVGTHVHISNPFIKSHLKINYVYDFADNVREVNNVERIKYVTYNVMERILEISETRKRQSVNYENFLDVRMVYDIIQSILQNVDLHENSPTVESKALIESKDLQKGVKEETQDMEKPNAGAGGKPSKKMAWLSNPYEGSLQNGNVIIVCNEGMTYQTKGKNNSISLIIAMCYLMYTKKCGPNLTIAYVLRINNNIKISAQTMNFLHKFHVSLKRCGYNLDVYYSHEMKRKMDKQVVTTGNKTNATSNEWCKTEQAKQKTQMDKYSTLKGIVQRPDFIEFIKSYKFENYDDALNNANESILPIDRFYLFGDMQLMNSMIKEQTHLFYETILQSLLLYKRNSSENGSGNNGSGNNGSGNNGSGNNSSDVHDDDGKANLSEIYDMLYITANIMNDKNLAYPRKILFFSLITARLCKSLSLYENCEVLHLNDGATEEPIIPPEKDKEMLKYNLLSLMCIHIEECMNYIMSYNFKKDSQNKYIEEYKLSVNTDENYLLERNIDRDCYVMFLSLRYLLISFLCYYMFPTFTSKKYSYSGKVTYLLVKIDKFSAYYYSVFNININLFQKNDYKAQICSYDKLPLYFKDLLRPFLIINNHMR
ncbi:mitogen-activated protein kinase phosphatase 1, putative [Plasmodium vivax]|uniref:Mitogen-activated protein kinase phosphatase 1, putative n=1 Tax=Plasmodium vivax TaxID=5855 RepID=A0A565A2D9_PLAVI|nr:mitogen-activated protein kinase phosphatase 1, putative [Plasmodium vivax]